MVQLLRLATATSRGASTNTALNFTSFPADFTVNIQNNITVRKNASVALKGLTFSTNDGVYIQVPDGLNLGVSGSGGNKTTVYQTASFPAGKFTIPNLTQQLFNTFINAYDFQQLTLNNALNSNNTRGLEIIPKIDNDKKLNLDYYINPQQELSVFDATTSKLNLLTVGADANKTTTITDGTTAEIIASGGCNAICKLMLNAGCFQYKVNLAHLTNVLTLNNNNFVIGLISASKTSKTNLLIDDYLVGVYLTDGLKYCVKYNNVEYQSQVVANQFDIVYFVNQKGKIAVYVESRTNANFNTRNTSTKIFDAAPYSISDISQLSLSGYYCAMTFLGTSCQTYGVYGTRGGSYYTATSTQSIDNNGEVVDEPSPDITLTDKLDAFNPSPSGDIPSRNGKAVGVSFQNGLYQILNTNTILVGIQNVSSGTILGNGIIKLAIYGDIIVELLNFDLSSYNSNYPDRKSILYVVEKLDEAGQTGSNQYSFDVNYPIFLNIFNRDDININSFQIRITKDGVPINLTSGATLTILIDG